MFPVLKRPLSGLLGKPLNPSGGGIPLPSTPLRFATVQNRSYSGPMSVSGKDRYYFRWKHILGANMGTLAIGSLNWTLQDTGNVNIGNAWTYEGVSIEGPNGVSVPVRWGGSTTKSIGDGDNNIISDEIPAVLFGTTLNRGDTIWVKGVISFAAGQKVPAGYLQAAHVTNSQSGFYVSTDTTLSSINSSGVFTFTGTAPVTTGSVFSPIMLGRPLVDGLSYLGVGDSIIYGATDVSNDQEAYGAGLFQRSMHANFTNPVPSMNFSTPGIGVGAFNDGNTKWTAWCVYATRGIDELLTNNVGNQTVSTMQGQITAIWSRLRAAGTITKIIRMNLLANTSSLDSWATTLNQTPVDANWDAGGRKDQMNTYFVSQVGVLIEAYSNMVGTLLDTNPDLYAANGTPNRMTIDGLHPYQDNINSVGCATAGNVLRTTRVTLG